MHTDLKPLSANLKRLEMGIYLFDPEYKHLLEENRLDDIWEQAIDEHNNKKVFFSADIDYEENVEIFLEGINFLYEMYLLVNDKHVYELRFNNFLKTTLIYYIESNNTKKDYSKLIKVLSELKIVTPNTLNNLIKVINKIPKEIKPLLNELSVLSIKQKKYQIFISSTYTDLIEERQAAVEAILKKGHIPAGMELFAANNKSQWEVIKKWIDDSDIYMLILGGRYGSIDKETGFSYTEMEYNYAVEKKKPLFALVLDDEVIDNKSIEIIKEYDLKDEKYKAFKSNVISKMCSFPKNIDQIKLQTSYSLDDLIRDNTDTLIGWIRSS